MYFVELKEFYEQDHTEGIPECQDINESNE